MSSVCLFCHILLIKYFLLVLGLLCLVTLLSLHSPGFVNWLTGYDVCFPDTAGHLEDAQSFLLYGTTNVKRDYWLNSKRRSKLDSSRRAWDV